MATTGTALKKVVAVVFAASLLAGCSAEEAPKAASPQDGGIAAGDQIPSPASKTILEITGDITQKNTNEGIRLDMATLEDMPIVEATVYEPFLKADVDFSGVMMDDFVKIIGADPEAGGIRMTALDDFVADIPMSDLTSGTVLLATREDGKPLKVRAGGPARIVFLSDEGTGANTDMWIWSVKHMEVHP